MKLRPDLVLLPLDEDDVVFSEEAQCLVGLNASASFVLRKLLDGTPASQIAESLESEGLAAAGEAVRWVTTALDAFGSHAALVDRRIPPAALAVTTDEDQYLSHLAAKMPPFVPVQSRLVRRYRLLDTCVAIHFAMVEQVPWVDAVLGHLATDDGAAATATIDIRGDSLEDGRVRSYVYRDREPVGLATRLYRLGPVVKGALWQSAVNAHEFRFYVHAGVVGTNETCILLPAAAGSGKSSLTAALVHRGFRYFSDEVALIETSTFRVPPMPLAICVKSTGWDLMARYYPEISTALVHERMDGKRVRYLGAPAAAGAAQRASARVSHIIFPRYRADGSNEIRPVSRADALRRVMDECLALRQRLNVENIRELVRWISGIDCYELTFSSLDEAVDLVVQATKPWSTA